MKNMQILNKKITVVGLGYVGLPLAVAFAKAGFSVTGYDINHDRINEYQQGIDSTHEVGDFILSSTQNLSFTADIKHALGDIYIVAVPTPVTEQTFEPDLGPLEAASIAIGKVLKRDDLVIYESTVYPTITKDFCGRILIENNQANLTLADIKLGYSPERVNPGDTQNTVSSIVKLVAGLTPEISEEMYDLYSHILHNAPHKMTSIEAAEAVKLLENTQRDVNIAFMNEVAKYCQIMNLDTNEVVEGMDTKWNSLGFKPGLVGGHCIGVDPYYLLKQADEQGFDLDVVRSSRRFNEHIAHDVVSLVKKNHPELSNLRKVLVLGATFKANCPDFRNSKIKDLCNALSETCEVTIDDPYLNPTLADRVIHDDLNYRASYLRNKADLDKYDAVVFGVAHESYQKNHLDIISQVAKPNALIIDLVRIAKKETVNQLQMKYWGF